MNHHTITKEISARSTNCIRIPFFRSTLLTPKNRKSASFFKQLLFYILVKHDVQSDSNTIGIDGNLFWKLLYSRICYCNTRDSFVLTTNVNNAAFLDTRCKKHTHDKQLYRHNASQLQIHHFDKKNTSNKQRNIQKEC